MATMMSTRIAALVFLALSISIPFQSLAGAALPPPPAYNGGKPAPPVNAPPPQAAMVPAPAPAPWTDPVPVYAAQPLPKPVMQACVRTPFPDLCARALSVRVNPKLPPPDQRRIAEMTARVAIQAGTALAAFGYVHFAGAKNGTKLRACVRDCCVRVDAAVKSLNASVSAMRRGEREVAMQQLGAAANGCGVCWGSCLQFGGEAMPIILKRAHEFQRLIMIIVAIAALL